LLSDVSTDFTFKENTMSDAIIAVYAEGALYPSTSNPQPVPTTIAQLQASGFNTLILGLFHIGRDYSISPPQINGDLYYNNTLVISKGTYVGDAAWPNLIDSIIGSGSGVTKICASIGGGGVMDYETIQKIYAANGHSFSGTNLMLSFQTFRKTFPAIDIIDLDCEETYDQPSFVAFCQMLIGLGFKITFCPYTYQDFWNGALKALNTSNPSAVVWWNLQCYDGGYGNVPDTWAAGIRSAVSGFNTNGFIVAGDWTNDTPSGVQALMSSFSGQASVGGGFLWTLDNMIGGAGSMSAFAQAVRNGLG
jgi:hypothetical protein